MENNKDSQIAIVLAHPNTTKRKNLLEQCLQNISIEKLVSCNFPIDTNTQNICDWMLYDCNNNLFTESEYDELGVSYTYWREDGIKKNIKFDHGYAAYTIIKNALLFCKSIGKEIVHIINYDYIIPQEVISNHNNIFNSNPAINLIVYHDDKDLSGYSTGFFSGKIDYLLLFFEHYKDKSEYYLDFDNNLHRSFYLEGKLKKFYSTKNQWKIHKNHFDNIRHLIRINQESLVSIENILKYNEDNTNNLNDIYTETWFDSHTKSSYYSSQRIVPKIKELYKPKSIIDVGGGVGAWCKTFEENQINALCIDGDYINSNQIICKNFLKANLESELPINSISKFNPDLAICLEVAEHLSPDRAETFINELTKTAPTIIFSAAIPGQGGTNHINEQPHEYWHKLFEKYGFEKTEELRNIVNTFTDVDWWYRQNIFTYIKKSDKLDNILARYRMIDLEEDYYVNERMTSVNRLFGLKDLLDYYNVDKKWKVLEIGSYAGASSELISYYAGELTCCDIWEEYIYPIERANKAYNEFSMTIDRSKNIIECKKNSNDLVNEIDDDTFDMIYIDADHSYNSVLNDIKKWFSKVKSGGVISGHDYYISDVKKAVDEFFGENNTKIFKDSSWSYLKPKIQENKSNKKFSIIVPTYKRTEILNRALNSIKNQTYKNYEVIVCSDGYSREDEICVQNFKDDRFTYRCIDKSEQKNWGHMQRNEMISFCKGDYTIFLDDDNIIYSDYLEYANNITDRDYGMLIFKIKHNYVGVIPKDIGVVLGEIDTLNIMVKTDIAKSFKWLMQYDADYYFIKECERYCLKTGTPIRYLDKVIGNHN